MKAARTTRVFLADSAATLEQTRKKLIERRNKLRAQLSGDPDPELRTQLEEIDRDLRALDRPQNENRGAVPRLREKVAE